MNKNIRPSSHAPHTKDASSTALAGAFARPLKITMLGAGSGFTPRLVSDILQTPGEAGGTIALVDIDSSRLTTMMKVVRKLLAKLGKTKWKVQASTNRREVLAGSHYIVNCIEVSGLDCVRFDNDIPLKYGVDQCIGDTIGPGGLFKALRTVPIFLEVLRDAERLCPEAIILNYTNPMNMMCLAAARTSVLPVVGLCHSVQGTSKLLARFAEIPYNEMEWECAGINHLAWFTTLRHNGKDLYPALKRKFAGEIAMGHREFRNGLVRIDALDPRKAKEGEALTKTTDLVRKDMCLHFGAFITESSGHLSEYLPYYRKSENGRRFLRPDYDGGSRFYASNWPDWRKAADNERTALLRGTRPMDWKRSWEYASWIIEAREKNVPFCIHGNVMNQTAGGGRLITNLPQDGCVEVACFVDRNGIQPTRHGALPPQMAALCASNMAVFDLGATAAIERSKEAAVHALLLDPLCAAVCSPSEIKSMALELFRAEKEFLPGYR